MLGQIFLKVLDMSRAAGMVIVVVFTARIFLKRFPRYLSYMLWGVVLFRLLCPLTFESPISPVPNLKPVFYEYTLERAAVLAKETGEFVSSGLGGEAGNVSESPQATPPRFYPNMNPKISAASWQEPLFA